MCVADKDDDNLPVSQVARKGKGVAEDEDVTVVRNLYKEFDGITSERAILIGRGYPCDGESQDTQILGIVFFSC